ncbi:hypothetical protein JTB14_009104 [Gonioctena quinquepunctata]|nr:hypothetical protein JTB14_009104 [Gonioctena quinquepunctata]
MMFLYQSQLIKINVTAIKLIGNHILTGIGSTLHVFHGNTSELIHKLVIPNIRGENIYGIAFLEPNMVLVYGGHFLNIFKVNNTFTSFDEVANNILLDWVLDAKWIDTGRRIVAVSLQNKLYIWNSDLQLDEIVECDEKCILYSAHICYDQYEDLTILSGTVFSEILIWKPSKRINNIPVILKRLQKHKGVIFSLDYNEKAGFICSTSDDRSAVLWRLKGNNLLTALDEEHINITPQSQVSGHLSRIFRCRVLNNCFLTAGEDSILNIWSFDGNLMGKVETHQGGPIWSLDCDENETFVITGGCDSGVSRFPINADFVEEKLILTDGDVPKIVSALGSQNLAVFSENGLLFLYKRSEKMWYTVKEHEDLKKYIVMEASECRNLIALAGYNGQIYIYKLHQNALHLICTRRPNEESRIASLHWLTCDMFLTCQANGTMKLFYLKQETLLAVSSFILPPSSERWTTTAQIFYGHIVVGDRRGNLHSYKIGKPEPVQTLKKVHSYLGVTKLIVQKNYLISLGRNAMVKHFSINNGVLKLLSSNKLPFTWLLNMFGDTLIAFSSNNFILWDCNSKRILFKTPCGGGHRSWDFYKSNNSFTFVYVKDKMINEIRIDMGLDISHDIVEAYHLKEINNVQILPGLCEYILISGGEDTTLRISSVNPEGKFKTHVTLKSHLSSIRSLAIHKMRESSEKGNETYLVFSAGGRAQIFCWKLECFFENNVLGDLTCSEQHSYYKVIDSVESEMRIMDLCVCEIGNKIVLFAACSDGNIQVFHVKQNKNFRLEFCKNVFYKLKCILLISHMRVFENDILISMATDGKLVFWDVSDIFGENESVPFESIQAHQSGINAFSMKKLENNRTLFLTGGDDNSVKFNYVEFCSEQGNLFLKKIDTFTENGLHWAQITGSFLNEAYAMTASIDQRLVVFRWRIENEKIVCNCISKYNSSVTDLKGLVCFENSDFDVFLYGNGIEFVRIVAQS